MLHMLIRSSVSLELSASAHSKRLRYSALVPEKRRKCRIPSKILAECLSYHTTLNSIRNLKFKSLVRAKASGNDQHLQSLSS
ncbi:hypothetical protein M514_28302 [Trichuris suis]|uniref:Uncharacterized protein n=1 Tax=Trichuris suis TaxID=68888 RepID=A0A085LNW7_9BILA|nr:hypothetical protein M513_12472 [Trichuris suis]KFD46664.1 hypothetical protein M513_12473 [Trichuris suis]KFD59519.1 hypothetical protein M514_28302 [Trichuris suis]